MRGILVTGTDTGIGKTYISVRLVKALKQMGLKVGVFKPVETGVDGVPQDALALKQAADSAEGLEAICPYVFRDPVAPWVAAEREGRPIRFSVIQEAYERIASSCDVCIVEGAGGLLVPLSEEGTYAGLAQYLDLSVLVVVGLRLGAINHTLLTLETAKNSGLKVLGYVLNEFQKDESAGATTVEEALNKFADFPCLGLLQHGADPSILGKSIARSVLSRAILDS